METLKIIWEIAYAIFACIGIATTIITIFLIIWFIKADIPVMPEEYDEFENLKN